MTNDRTPYRVSFACSVIGEPTEIIGEIVSVRDESGIPVETARTVEMCLGMARCKTILPSAGQKPTGCPFYDEMCSRGRPSSLGRANP
jgi:hypothetical protein